MNKIILSLGIAAFSVVSLFAQTNSITSGNKPTDDGNGYTFEFNGSAVDNCFNSKVPNPGFAQAGISVDSAANGKMYITTDGSAVAWGNVALRLNTDNCSDYNFDMSNPANQRIEIKIKTSVALNEFKVLLSDGQGQANDSLGVTDAVLPAGADTTLVFNQVDFHQWAASNEINSDDIANVHLYFRDDFQTQVAGSFEIEFIRLGTTAVPVGVDDIATATNVNAYPNPASDQVNFEEELSDLVIYNMVGVQVYEASVANTVDVSQFEAGVYFAQHSKGTLRFSVQ